MKQFWGKKSKKCLGKSEARTAILNF